MTISIIWALLSVIFLICEVFIPGALFFIGMAYGAFQACVFGFFGYPLITQLMQFILCSCIMYAFALYRFRKKRSALKSDPYISPLDALIGKEIIIHTQLDYDNAGYTSINGLEWLVRWNNDQTITMPQKARVIALKGSHLKVELI